jgi:DNA-directed RNA polymerase subunit RPC12/RpoP
MAEWEPPLDIRPSRTKQFVAEDGRKFWDSEIDITPQQAAKLHAGYLCARCFEPLEAVGAFPKRCPLCGFEVAKYQRQLLEEQYKGVDTSIVTPGIPLDRERAVMEREAYRPKGYVTMSVPKSKRRK